MDEHDDDLESKVHEGAEKEMDSYPETADELEDRPLAVRTQYSVTNDFRFFT